MKTHTKPEQYFLLDANLVATYYIPQSMGNKRVRERILPILESYRRGQHPEWYMMLPNICIAEVFSVLAKYCFATWNRHVQRNMPGGLDQRAYKGVRECFHNHIHNGHFFHQVELNRYHVLAVDLIAPVDHWFEHYRGQRRQKVPMGTSDQLILAMGIHLSHQLGRDRFAIVTADNRMADICAKASDGLAPGTAARLELPETAKRLGYDFETIPYPRVINLNTATQQGLRDMFGEWPVTIPARSTTGVKAPKNGYNPAVTPAVPTAPAPVAAVAASAGP